MSMELFFFKFSLMVTTSSYLSRKFIQLFLYWSKMNQHLYATWSHRYATITESGPPKDITICSKTASRERHLLVTQGNTVKLKLYTSSTEENPVHFLIRYTGMYITSSSEEKPVHFLIPYVGMGNWPHTSLSTQNIHWKHQYKIHCWLIIMIIKTF